MGIKDSVKDYLRGQNTKGRCMACKHSGKVGSTGCCCKSPWCPCHRKAYGHGAHHCNCK